MKYCYNASLFRILSQVLNVTKRDIAKAADANPPSINYWGREEDLPLAKLVAICNHFHIPISHFICPQDELSISIALSAFTIPASDYKPSILSIDTLSDRINEVSPMSIRQLARLLNINPQTAINYWSKGGSTEKITVQFFVNIINHSHIYPGELITSDNKPFTLLPDYHTIDSLANPLTLSNNTSVFALKRENKDLSRKVTSLEKENEVLNRKVKNFETRISELEEFMQSRISLASEPEG